VNILSRVAMILLLLDAHISAISVLKHPVGIVSCINDLVAMCSIQSLLYACSKETTVV